MKNGHGSKLFAIAAVVLLATQAHAVDSLAGAAGYLRSGAGARALGMGGAAVALVDDVTATVWNPAGLTRMGVYGTQIGSMVSFLSQDRNLNYLSLGQHIEGIGDFGLSLQNFSVDKIEGFDATGASTGFFSDQEGALGVSYANTIGYQFRYGLTGRGLYHGLADAKAFGYGADLGFQYQPSLASDFMVGALLQNPVANLTWDTGHEDPVTPVLRLGLSDKYMNQRFDIAADVEAPLAGDGSMIPHLGAEIWLIEGLGARAGLDGKDFTAGGTWKIDFYQVDYAYVMSNVQLGDSQQVSLILRF